MKPVEGTILTVARETARHAIQIARRTNIVELLEAVVYGEGSACKDA